MKINSAEFITSATALDNCPESDIPEYAFIGRSNVGKSSLMNMLLERKNLVKTSKKPGKTTTLNFFLINEQFYFVDLPGYGFARRAQLEQRQWREGIEHYLTERGENLRTIFLLVDSRHAIQPNDEQMIEFLNYHKLSYTIVYTKVDKLKKNEMTRLKNKAQSVFFASAVTKQGREELWAFIESSL